MKTADAFPYYFKVTQYLNQLKVFFGISLLNNMQFTTDNVIISLITNLMRIKIIIK